MPKEAFLSGVDEKGYMDESMKLQWIRVVWNQPGALLRPHSMLVLDAFRSQVTEAVKCALGNGKTDLVVMRGGTTSTLQLPDIVLTKPFKDQVQLEYPEGMSGNNPKTPTGPHRGFRLQSSAARCFPPGVLCQMPWRKILL